MPVNIGRGNIRSRMTSGNQGMARRVDNKLDAVVDAYAARFKTALAVDGSVAFIYNKHEGVVACTCRGFRNLSGIVRHDIGLSGHETDRGDSSFTKDQKVHTSSSNNLIGGLKQVGSLKPDELDHLFQNRNETVVEKISESAEDEGFTADGSADLIDAMFDNGPANNFSGDGDPMTQIIAATNLGNSSDFAYSPHMVACPICFGAGYVDTWKLYNGERIVLDASNRYEIETYNDVVLDDDNQPAVYSIRERSTLQWNNVAIPTSWRHLIRLKVFNGLQEVPQDAYTLYYEHPSQPGVRNLLTYQNLNLLNNKPILFNSNKLTIYIESNLGYDYPLVITHVEMLFSLGEAVRVQVPEADVPNEDEYVDWNLNVQLELPSDVEIRENSYVVEGKYQRVWKVTQINRKMTARGKSFGYSVGVRALHSFERQYSLMNVFGIVRNPFYNQAIKGMDESEI
ncbi:hypothetical protein EVB87_253 [Rhizobium phage RHph_N28_1]|nr:hypothetical protein EVB87_253 [Rhizobium phage RHph_N28_1]